MVTGAEKEEYIRVAMEKAHHLKDFVTALFEWLDGIGKQVMYGPVSYTHLSIWGTESVTSSISVWLWGGCRKWAMG